MDLIKILPSYLAAHRIRGKGVDTYRDRISRWKRSKCETAEQFRSLHFGQLSNTTIEQTIGAIERLHRFAGVPFEIGKRLPLPKPNPIPPEVRDIGLMYSAVGVATWPRKLPQPERTRWWQALLCVALWTGFRFGDIESLEWSHIHKYISKPSEKTEKQHHVPRTSMIDRHLAEMPRIDDTVFFCTKTRKQFRRELRLFCRTAGVENITMQNIRQASINLWTMTDAKAGEIIHGFGLRGVMAHYLACTSILENVAPRVQMPPEMLTADERQQLEDEEQELIRRYRTAPSQQRGFILQAARLTA